MDKEMMSLVDYWNNPLCDKTQVRASIKFRINSNNASQTCCTDSKYHERKALNDTN